MQSKPRGIGYPLSGNKHEFCRRWALWHRKRVEQTTSKCPSHNHHSNYSLDGAIPHEERNLLRTALSTCIGRISEDHSSFPLTNRSRPLLRRCLLRLDCRTELAMQLFWINGTNKRLAPLSDCAIKCNSRLLNRTISILPHKSLESLKQLLYNKPQQGSCCTIDQSARSILLSISENMLAKRPPRLVIYSTHGVFIRLVTV